MDLLKNIYTITMYENGKFCWVVEKKKKGIKDYRSDIKWMIALVLISSIATLILVT
tara:strand:- start:92 stop:259 length:168 start_codon:yes stop_codon:yes gene_type:complete